MADVQRTDTLRKAGHGVKFAHMCGHVVWTYHAQPLAFQPREYGLAEVPEGDVDSGTPYSEEVRDGAVFGGGTQAVQANSDSLLHCNSIPHVRVLPL